jgi:hypothetical protein
MHEMMGEEAAEFSEILNLPGFMFCGRADGK